MGRDGGWYEVLEAMRQNPAAAQALEAWYPKDAGILQMVEALQKSHPSGFVRRSPEEVVGRLSPIRESADVSAVRRLSAIKDDNDVLGCEKCDVALHGLKKMKKAVRTHQMLAGGLREYHHMRSSHTGSSTTLSTSCVEWPDAQNQNQQIIMP